MISARTLLFPAGGEGGARACAEEFVQAAGGGRGRLALLLHGGPNTQRYVPRYSMPLRACGQVHAVRNQSALRSEAALHFKPKAGR